MASDTPDADPDRRTVPELLAMDEAEARRELTVVEYERWESVRDLHDQHEATKQRWADEAEQVHDIVVEADPEALGTEVELYGNEVLVHIREDDDAFREAAAALDTEFGETATDDVPELGDEDREAMAGHLRAMYDAALVRWNDHEWADLPEETRAAILDDALDKWGLSSFFLGLVQISAAVREAQQETVDVVDSFRGAAGRGDR